MLMGVKEIQEIIPHRHPFLLVDCIEELEPGVRAVGYKCVTYDESFFKGHFPQEPVMPGVLLIEALAQTGAVAFPTPTGPFCLMISHSSFTLSPGTTLRLNLAFSMPPK